MIVSIYGNIIAATGEEVSVRVDGSDSDTSQEITDHYKRLVKELTEKEEVCR